MVKSLDMKEVLFKLNGLIASILASDLEAKCEFLLQALGGCLQVYAGVDGGARVSEEDWCYLHQNLVLVGRVFDPSMSGVQVEYRDMYYRYVELLSDVGEEMIKCRRTKRKKIK